MSTHGSSCGGGGDPRAGSRAVTGSARPRVYSIRTTRSFAFVKALSLFVVVLLLALLPQAADAASKKGGGGGGKKATTKKKSSNGKRTEEEPDPKVRRCRLNTSG